MEFIKKYKNIVIGIVLVAAAAVVYTVFIKGKEIDTSLLTSKQHTEGAELVGEELLQLLATLRAIELNDGLFQDPTFRGLEDFSQELVPEPVGRPNPFLPIGAESRGSVTEEF